MGFSTAMDSFIAMTSSADDELDDSKNGDYQDETSSAKQDDSKDADYHAGDGSVHRRHTLHDRFRIAIAQSTKRRTMPPRWRAFGCAGA
jgi:hypothetical protein